MGPARLGRVVDILEASGAFDPGSNPGRGVFAFRELKTACSHRATVFMFYLIRSGLAIHLRAMVE